MTDANAKIRIDKKTTRRLVWMFVLFLAVGAIIVGYLAYYQLKMYDYYESQVLNQLTIQTEVNPERGTITDRNGNILATNVTVYNVILSPSDIHERIKADTAANSDDNPDNDVLYEYSDPEAGISYKGTSVDDCITEVLSRYLDVSGDFIREKIAKEKRQFEVIKKNVDEELADKIKDFIASFGIGIHTSNNFNRF